MKMASKLILFIFMLTNASAWAAAEVDCAGYDHPAYQDEYRTCLRLQIAKSAGDQGVDCIDCLFKQETTGTNNWVAALSAVAQPLAYLAGTYTVASYQNKTQKAWADAYKSGYEECTNRFNSYLDYNTAAGANPLTAAEANSMSMSCNSYGYGSYAGYGGLTSNGYGGYGNPFQSAGYSSGFLNGYGGSWPGLGSSSSSSGMLSGGIGVGAFGTLGTSSSVYQSGVTSAFGF
ncbi:hypothetical protein SHI21_16255 [Bacteriovorax sp. PP10]|uniref:Lipoprotein n=1 Tax=Bacteriovorax antarcticus TaxID=3088717 RepID=A0ABU5W0J1_9BACT|nr:hypothetical protein [Bacteriovorax sp. PP10]MEA9357785.1 hypothetical protein [Bacteriovorax sp. PP10]